MKTKRTSTEGNVEKLNSETAGAILNVVVETPKGSRNKFAFDPAKRALVLRKVLPEGMKFPHDFGFIPSTRGEDGDPLDVLIFLDEPTFPGCVVEVRLIGFLEGEKSEEGRKITDHRFIAVANESRTYLYLHPDHQSRGIGSPLCPQFRLSQFRQRHRNSPGYRSNFARGMFLL
jgi:inorganic pyrophosphatase